MKTHCAAKYTEWHKMTNIAGVCTLVLQPPVPCLERSRVVLATAPAVVGVVAVAIKAVLPSIVGPRGGGRSLFLACAGQRQPLLDNIADQARRVEDGVLRVVRDLHTFVYMCAHV